MARVIRMHVDGGSARGGAGRGLPSPRLSGAGKLRRSPRYGECLRCEQHHSRRDRSHGAVDISFDVSNGVDRRLP